MRRDVLFYLILILVFAHILLGYRYIFLKALFEKIEKLSVSLSISRHRERHASPRKFAL